MYVICTHTRVMSVHVVYVLVYSIQCTVYSALTGQVQGLQEGVPQTVSGD